MKTFHVNTKIKEKKEKKHFMELDVQLFALPCSLPCGPPGGTACCSSTSVALAGDCLPLRSGT